MSNYIGNFIFNNKIFNFYEYQFLDVLNFKNKPSPSFMIFFLKEENKLWKISDLNKTIYKPIFIEFFNSIVKEKEIIAIFVHRNMYDEHSYGIIVATK